MANSNKGTVQKAVWWILAIVVFYIFTTARVSTETVELSKKVGYASQEPIVVEKLVKTTKYRTEKVPFGSPRCEQMNYNYSYRYSYAENYADGKKIGTCTFNVKNEEDIPGTFDFYVQFFRNGQVNDGPDQVKTIEAFSTETYEWNLTMGVSDTLTCLLQVQNPPHRAKCFYLEPITYSIKEVPYTVEELKNVTEYNTIPLGQTSIKQNVTQNVYTNRFFGYRQFFFLGY